jgi:Domain of unknown function (DUF4292)
LQKIVAILILLILIQGCSVTRKIENNINENSGKKAIKNVLEDIEEQNITNNNFLIQKAEIQIESGDRKEKYLANIKFERPDKYLISIKSRTGIEGARIYISNDSVLVNDRINKKLYVGTSFYIEKKYGLSLSCLPLIFGDIVLNRNDKGNSQECNGDKLNINSMVKGVLLNYEIGCRERKTKVVNQLNSLNEKRFEIKTTGFWKIGNILIPKRTEFEDYQQNIKILIRYIKVEIPWGGSVKFSPGKGYELIKLV